MTIIEVVYGVHFNPKTRKFEPGSSYQRPGVPSAQGSATGGNKGTSTPGGQPSGVPLGQSPAPPPQVAAGQYVIGYQDDGFDNPDDATPYHAFITTSDNSNYIDLGTLDPGNSNAASFAWGISDDGSVVVGYSDFSDGTTQHAFSWSQAGGLVDLGSAGGAAGLSQARGVSGDGSTIIVNSGSPQFPDSLGAYLWTAASGYQSLGSIGCPVGEASAITDDASVVVGQAGTCSGASVAFRWTQAGGMVGIGALSGDGDTNAAATGVSDNGQIVVGISAPRPLTLGNTGFDWGTDTHAFRWTQQTGMQDLTALFTAAGVDMTGITLVSVNGISADGQDFVGEAITPDTPQGGTTPFLAKYCDADIADACVSWFAAHDFNGDGMSDVLWRDNSGNLASWLMSGSQIASGVSYGQVPQVWSVVGSHDFNGDGSADILWRDTGGDLAVWLMNGASVSSYNGLGNVGTQWTVAGAGDFNDDGTGDILWRNTSTGDVAIWFMSGGQFSSGADLGTVPLNWSIVGVGDFNNDGYSDILWLDTAGDLAVWLMNGGQVSSPISLGNVGTAWSVIGTGDFDGDGNSDILWRDSSGDVAIWLMNNGQFSSGATLGRIPSTWSVAVTGDFDGNGTSDILWIDQSGDLGLWFMNGLTIGSAAGLGNVGTSWQVQGRAAD